MIGNVAVFAGAIYFRLPFFLSRTNRQRFLISAVLAVPIVFVTYYCMVALLSAALDFGGSTSDKRIESVTLPSGEVLVNHTFREGPSLGGSGERMNKLFLNNPTNGTSELVGDLNYEGEPNGPALLQRYPHPREFVHGDEKVLIIGPYVCQRCIWKTGPEWGIASFGGASGDAKEYLRSFVKTNSAFFSSPYSGPEEFLHYQIENLDSENNVLTVKRFPWNAQTEPPEFRDFPDCRPSSRRACPARRRRDSWLARATARPARWIAA